MSVLRLIRLHPLVPGVPSSLFSFHAAQLKMSVTLDAVGVYIFKGVRRDAKAAPTAILCFHLNGGSNHPRDTVRAFSFRPAA